MNNYVNEWLLAPDGRRRARLIVGGVCLDEQFWLDQLNFGQKNRIRERYTAIGGGAANGARVHRHLAPESNVVLLSAVGADRTGLDIRRHMAEQRIEMPWPAIVGGATSLSYILNHEGAGTVAMDPGVREEPIPLDLLDAALRHAEACCLVSPNNQAIAPVTRQASIHGVKVYFGLGSSQVKEMTLETLRAEVAGPLELVICNVVEAAKLTNQSDPEEMLESLHEATGARQAVVTDGSGGLYGLGDEGHIWIEAYCDRRPVVDDVGAGDAAQATIVHCLIAGMSLAEAMRAGARQGFEVATARGTTTALVSAEELSRHLELVAA